jgi:beta-hydroxylase
VAGGAPAALTFTDPRILILAIYAVAVAYVHVRGKERHPLIRQVADHSTILAPYNMFVYLVSGVPNRPVVDMAAFPGLERLTASWETIRDEARALHEAGSIGRPRSHDDVAFDSLYRRGWKRFYLKWYGDCFPSARSLCPKTVEILQGVPEVTAAMFALLPPHSELGRHRDPYAGSLRYHLGLITPNADSCRIFVDGHAYSWRDGQAFMFDETYMHWARNDTDETRIILFCDVERPLRYRWAQALNRVFARVLGRATTTGNVPGEAVGFVNRAYDLLYHVRTLGLRLKNFNRTLYRAVKLLLVAGVVWLILLAF